MKKWAFSLALIGLASVASAGSVIEPLFRVSAKLVCSAVKDSTTAKLDKNTLTNDDVIDIALGLTDPNGFDIVYNPGNDKLQVVESCNGESVADLVAFAFSGTSAKAASDSVKFAHDSFLSLVNWGSTTVTGALQCTYSGVEKNDLPVSVKGTCTGAVHFGTSVCQLQAHVTKPFKAAGMCIPI
ncbi:MAG TPA: hypothetical protein VMR50_06625 [Myxococcota bacterium]|nr:hypothetical protein [Myxococcota bacterium]